MRVPTIKELESIPPPKGPKGKRWGYCGLAAMSAATGIEVLDIHAAIPNWPGYTPSKMVIPTLEKFGYVTRRVLIPKAYQQVWPLWKDEYPCRIAMGRIYWGEGKFAGSHWIVLRWDETMPLFYDNCLRYESWATSTYGSLLDYFKDIHGNPKARLASLYFVCCH